MRFKTYFKDLLDPTIIVGVIIILAISIILTVFFSSRVESFKQKYRNKFLSYLLGLLLVFALITFMGSSEVFDSQMSWVYFYYQVAAFILGIVHTYAYRNYFNRFEKKSVWIELLFALIMCFYVAIPMVLIYTIAKGNIYAYFMSTSVVAFLIPSIIYAAFEASISIQPKIYKTWQFPEEHAYPDPLDEDYRDMLVVTFAFQKDPNSDLRTEFRAKAPIRMDFGRLFYHFVNDYNLRNPDAPIRLSDKQGERQHWVFYLKSKKLGFAKYIRPGYPLYMNSIEENSVIICERTSALLNEDEAMGGTVYEDTEETVQNVQNDNF